MAFFCTRCGSVNHKAMDCSAPDQNLTPPPPPKTDLEKHDEATGEEINAYIEGRQPGWREESRKLDPPRWPNGPQVCTKTNRAAFKDVKTALTFYEDSCPGVKIKKGPYSCDFCGMFHVEGIPRGPAGATSGNERENNLPKNFKPFIRASTRHMTAQIEEAQRRRSMDLPKQRPDEEVPPKTQKSVDKPAVVAPRLPARKSAGELF